MSVETNVDSFDSVLQLYAEELTKVETEIEANFSSDVTMIPKVSRYLISGGGKRVRPLLLIATSKFAGYKGENRHITLGVVAEYIHAATLLHDDVVDSSDMRRGIKSANITFGNKASVLVGDFLFAKSFQMMSMDNDPRIIDAMSMATKNLAEGEILQLVGTGNCDLTEQEYFDTIYRKTGALMEACCVIGSILGGQDQKIQKTMGQFGRKIGIAFQLVDDLLDYTADPDKWGKPLGADICEGKMTLPLIHAMANTDPDTKNVLIRAVKAGMEGEELPVSVDEIIAVFRKEGSLEYTKIVARKAIEDAVELLDEVDRSIDGNKRDKNAISAVAHYIVERSI